LVSGLKAVIPLAQQYNLTINLSNRYGSRVEQLDDLRYVFQKINHPRLQVLLNTGQFHLASVNPRDAFREFGDRVSLIRVADLIGDIPVPLGEGEINVPAVIEHLKRIEFKGCLIVQPVSARAESWPEYLPQATAYLHDLIKAD